MRQIIALREDLNMSSEVLARQMTKGAICFIASKIIESAEPMTLSSDYVSTVVIDKNIYNNWLCSGCKSDSYIIPSKDKLMKLIDAANSIGLCENMDYFIIRDALKEKVEEVDKNGVGTTITGLSFRPLNEDMLQRIFKEFHKRK